MLLQQMASYKVIKESFKETKGNLYPHKRKHGMYMYKLAKVERMNHFCHFLSLLIACS